MILNKDRIVSYEEIEKFVWNDEYMSFNSLRTTIGFFEKKFHLTVLKTFQI